MGFVHKCLRENLKIDDSKLSDSELGPGRPRMGQVPVRQVSLLGE